MKKLFSVFLLFFVLACGGGGETGIVPVSVPVEEPIIEEPVVEEEKKYPKPDASELDAFLSSGILPYSFFGEYHETPVDGVLEYSIEAENEEVAAIFRRAASEWKSALPFRLVEVEPAPGVLLIRAAPNEEWSCGGHAALGVYCYNDAVAWVTSHVCDINPHPNGMCIFERGIYNTAIHEMGHALGFGGHPGGDYQGQSIMVSSGGDEISPLDWWGMKYIWENFEIGDSFPETFDTAEWLEQQD